MAITNGYATLAQFKSWNKIGSTDADDDTVIESCIESASRFIDIETGRTFYARTETRKYSVPSDLRALVLDDDLLTITTLTNGDGNTIASSEYNLWPVNTSPYRRIILKSASTTFWLQDSSSNVDYVISVAGTWGYVAATPTDIYTICLIAANAYYKRRAGESTSSVARVTAMGVVLTPQDMPGIVADTIRSYKGLT